MNKIAGLLLLTMLFAGCYSWTAIKPTELPKLNAAPAVVSNPRNGQVHLIKIAQLETPDGRLAEIQGASNARVNLKDGTSTLFEHPIMSTVENQALTIMSGNNPKTTIPLDRIQSIEVSSANPNDAAGIISFIGFILSIVVLVGFIVVN